jgi:hypothetical protein
VVLRLSCLGRYLAPGRRRELEAEALSALRRSAVRRVADQRAVAHPEVLSVRRLRREVVSFRRQAADLRRLAEQAAHPVGARLVLSSSRHLHRAAVRRCAAEASSVRHRQEVSSKVLRPEARLREAQLSKAQSSAEPLWWAAFPRVSPLVLQAHAFRRRAASPCAHRPEASSCRRQAVSSWSQPEASWLLPRAALSAWCARAVSRLREAAAVGSDAGAAQPWAEPGASVQPSAVARQEVSAAAVAPQRVVPAAVWDAAEALRQAAGVSGAEVEPQSVAAWAVLPRAEWAASQRAAVRPSAAPWVFRRDRALPCLVRRRAARSARAMRMSQAASPSERSWQAARCEGLS